MQNAKQSYPHQDRSEHDRAWTAANPIHQVVDETSEQDLQATIMARSGWHSWNKYRYTITEAPIQIESNSPTRRFAVVIIAAVARLAAIAILAINHMWRVGRKQTPRPKLRPYKYAVIVAASLIIAIVMVTSSNPTPQQGTDSRVQQTIPETDKGCTTALLAYPPIPITTCP